MSPMSSTLSPAAVEALRIADLAYLAPRFRLKVERIIERLRETGHPAVVRETVRLPALQAHYFATGTSKSSDALGSWHAYGLACDIVHTTLLWSAPPEYWEALGAAAKAEGCAWGGDWKSIRDTPHVQWGPGMRASPSDRGRTLRATGGNYAVWQAVGAVGVA